MSFHKYTLQALLVLHSSHLWWVPYSCLRFFALLVRMFGQPLKAHLTLFFMTNDWWCRHVSIFCLLFSQRCDCMADPSRALPNLATPPFASVHSLRPDMVHHILVRHLFESGCWAACVLIGSLFCRKAWVASKTASCIVKCRRFGVFCWTKALYTWYALFRYMLNNRAARFGNHPCLWVSNPILYLASFWLPLSMRWKVLD